MRQVALQEIADLNARIDRLPKWGLGWGVLVLMAASYFFAFYDITAIGVVLPTVISEFHLQGSQIALPLTTNLIGYIVGAYWFGSMADSLGRKKSLAWALLVLSVGGFLTAFSWDDLSLSVFRFLTGVGIGAQISVCATIMTELSPAKQRAKYVQMNVIWAGIGNAVSPLLGVGLIGIAHIGWRLVFAVGGLAIIALAFIRWLPESPRWLALRGQARQAEEIVAKMEKNILNDGIRLPEVPSVPPEQEASGFPTLALFQPPYLSRLLVVFVFWILFYLVVYGFLGYEPVLLGKMGLTKPQSVLYTALGDLAFPIGAALPLLLVNRIPRKYILFIATLVMALAMAVLATSHSGFTVFLGAFLMALMILSASGVAYTYTAEIFPTRARASAMSISDGVGHLGGVIAPFIILAGMEAWGARGAFWLMCVLLILSGVLIVVGGVSTKSEGLTELSK
jgi:putative MFS transporter